MSLCGAKNRLGRPCQQPAGAGTDHPGEGRCRHHGGRSKTTHGRYSRYSSRRLADRLAHLDEDPDPLNLLPEVKMIRALASDFIDRYEEYRAALLQWNADEASEALAEKRKPRPQRILDISDASSLLEQVSRVVDKITKQQASDAVTIEQVSTWFHEFGKVVAKHADPTAVSRIEKEWGAALGGPRGVAGRTPRD